MLLIALQFVTTCIGIVLGLLVLSGIIIALQFAWNVFKEALSVKGK